MEAQWYKYIYILNVKALILTFCKVPKPEPVYTKAELAQQAIKSRQPKMLTYPAFVPRPNPPNTELRR